MLFVQSHHDAQQAKQCRRKKPTLAQQMYLTIVYVHAVRHNKQRLRRTICHCPVSLTIMGLFVARCANDHVHWRRFGWFATQHRQRPLVPYQERNAVDDTAGKGGRRYASEWLSAVTCTALHKQPTMADVLYATTLAHLRPRCRWWAKTEKPLFNGSASVDRYTNR